MSEPHLPIKGFDSFGEPVLLRCDGGALELVFTTMPPESKSGGAGQPELFDDFERVLSNVLSTPVVREDRERFIIANPYADTAKTLATYLSDFWKTHAQQLSSEIAAASRETDSVFVNDLEFREAMRDVLEPLFRPHGFTSSMAGSLTFYRCFSGGHDRIAIFTDGRNDVTRVEPCVDYGVQHAIVERLVSICCEQERKYLKTKLTSGAHRITMPPDAPIVSRASQVAQWAAVFAPLVESQLLPGLACWRSLGAIGDVLNNLQGGAENYEKLPTSYQYNGPRGVIIARLLDDPKLEETIAFHAQYISNDDPDNWFHLYQQRSFATACDLARSKSLDELQTIADAF